MVDGCDSLDELKIENCRSSKERLGESFRNVDVGVGCSVPQREGTNELPNSGYDMRVWATQCSV